MLWNIKKHIKPTWLISLTSLGVTGGVSLSLLSLWVIPIVFTILGIGLLLIVFWKRRFWSIPVALMGGLLIGFSRGASQRILLNEVEPFYGETVSLAGVVSDDPVIGAGGTTSVKLGQLVVAAGKETRLPGSLFVSVGTKSGLKRSYVIIVRGVLTKSDSGYPSMYRAQLLKYTDPMPGDIARKVRDWFVEAVRHAIPDPQASLGVGYLVGQKAALPQDLLEALQIAGLTHVVVASGYNLTILVRLCRRLLARLSKFTAFMGSVLLVICMMAVTGLSPSMVRAGLVTAFSLTTWYYGRSFHPLVLLPLAAALTTLFQPDYAWGDVGWLLSFTAFAGVMIVSPLLQRFFFGTKEPGVMRQVLGETVAAHIVTLPVIALTFAQISNVAIFSNILIVPLVPIAMLLTFMAGIGALIVPPFAPLFGLPATGILYYMTQMTEWWAALPWAQFKVSVTWWSVVIMYLCILLGCFVLKSITKYSFLDSNIVK